MKGHSLLFLVRAFIVRHVLIVDMRFFIYILWGVVVFFRDEQWKVSIEVGTNEAATLYTCN